MNAFARFADLKALQRADQGFAQVWFDRNPFFERKGATMGAIVLKIVEPGFYSFSSSWPIQVRMQWVYEWNEFDEQAVYAGGPARRP